MNDHCLGLGAGTTCANSKGECLCLANALIQIQRPGNCSLLILLGWSNGDKRISKIKIVF